MIGKYWVVEGDLFDISGRLREIDEGYFVVYSYRDRRFEVHHSEQKGGTLAFVVPYDRLDVRTLIHARKTRRERIDKLLMEMSKAEGF